jgi:beta-1,4-mannosyl-glycoprotein beta-1,4-N-acetylglucosaminyltransferase
MENDMNTLIFDVFCYNGEPIVELRLALLAPVVDRFYIVESRSTFSGLSKPALYKDINSGLFEPYESQITWIILDDDYFHSAQGNAWRREAKSRNAPLEHIFQHMAVAVQRSPYLLLVCDVDEIPRPEIVMSLRHQENYLLFKDPVALQMDFFYYNFAWIKNFKWNHPYVVSEETLLKRPDLDTIRLSPKSKQVSNAGWHCSFFETMENIIRKIESFSHQEHNKESMKSPAYICACMAGGIDVFARGVNEDLVPYQITELPDQMQAFHHKIVEMQQRFKDV